MNNDSTTSPKSGTSAEPADVSVILPPTQPPAPVSPKKASKWVHVAIIALGVIVVLAIIGVAIYLVFFYISKTDYKKAEAQTNTVKMSYNRADSTSDTYYEVVSSDASTDIEINAKLADYRTTRTDYQSAIDTLASQRALKNSKVKAAYDAFVTKNNVFMAYIDTMDQTMPTMRKIAISCSGSKTSAMQADDLSKIVSAYDKVMNPCTDAMKELSVSKNADAAMVGKKSVTYLNSLRSHLVAMQAAYIANNRTTFESEYNAFVDVSNSFSTDTDTSSLQKHLDSLTPVASLDNLLSVIRSQE